MKEAETLVQFMALKLDLQEAVEEIGRLAEAGFGKRPLLKKDYQVFSRQLTFRGSARDRSSRRITRYLATSRPVEALMKIDL
jgi:hypothetical protein